MRRRMLGVPVFQPARMRAPEVYADYAKLEPDLNVMAFVTDILPLSILNYPKLGTIQYHPSLLPKHRGGNAINWAIINGETKTGKAPRITQDESQASYEVLYTENEAIIDWSQPASNVYNLIRGTNPQPGATTYFQGAKLKFFDSELLGVSQNKPAGEIWAITDKGIIMSAEGGAILVKRVQPQGPANIAALEYAQAVALKAGDRFEPKGRLSTI